MCPLAAIAAWCVIAVSTPTLSDAARMDFVAQSVPLPNVVGERVGRAATRLKKLGLVTQRRRISSSRPAGEVVRQDPEPGVDVYSIKDVTLFVSDGAPATVGMPSTMPTIEATTPNFSDRMPDFLGRTGAYARKFLVAHDFREPVLIRGSSKYPVGLIYSQLPAAGVELRRAETITLYVSTGVASASPVPATSTPTQVALSTPGSTSTPLGSQSIHTAGPKLPGAVGRTGGGAPQLPGTKAPSVPATAAPNSTAPAPTAVPTVPSFVGRSSADARQFATANGLREPLIIKGSSNYPVNQIYRQDPAPGMALRGDMTIALYVSTGPPPRRLPPWTPVLIFGAVLGISLAAKTWSHAHSVEKTRRIFAIHSSVDLSGTTNFPSGVRTAGPTIEVKTRVEPGDGFFHGPVPIVRKEMRHD